VARPCLVRVRVRARVRVRVRVRVTLAITVTITVTVRLRLRLRVRVRVRWLGRARAPCDELAGPLVHEREAVAVEQRAGPAEDAARCDEQRRRPIAPRGTATAEDEHRVVLGVGWHVERAGPGPERAVRDHDQRQHGQQEQHHRHRYRDEKPPGAPSLGSAVASTQERGREHRARRAPHPLRQHGIERQHPACGA